MKSVLIILLCLSSFIIAQPEKVINIEEDNSILFESGLKVKLAGINFPNKFHPDSIISRYALKLTDSLTKRLLGKYFYIERDNTNREIGVIPLVHLTERVNATKIINLNETFLKNGLGIFTADIDEDYLALYKLAGNDAKVNKEGYWKVLCDQKYNELSFLSEQEIRELKKEILFADRGLISGLKIKHIIDANLFELSNGVQFKMADIDVPSITDTDPDLRKVAKDAVKFAKSKLQGYKVESEFFYTSDSEYPKTYLRKEFPLTTKDFQEVYLQKGFAKILGDLPKEYFEDYNKAQKDAISNAEGIWGHGFEINQLVLDKDLTEKEILHGLVPEKSELSDYIPERPNSAFIREVLIGSAAGFLGAVVGGYSAVNLSDNGGFDDIGYALIGLYGGAILSGSYGVYLHASNYDPDLYYSEVLGFSLLTGVAIVGLSSQIADLEDYYLYTAFFAPIIVSALFVESHYDPLAYDYSLQNHKDFKKTNITHQDIYNSSKLLDVNILSINF